ncbi:DUF397 domain-containing protein [Streptomyces sp. NPDC048504]|uniref:DUF397 domain-containing protein n=1 Tax=Streptomyces sp. NPDC048504 TaxID=3365559 RepID=UPI003722A155
MTRTCSADGHRPGPYMDQEQLQRPQQQLHGIPHPPPLGKAVVRDSKDPHRRMIVFHTEAWAPFVHAYRTGGLVKATTH